MIIRTSVPIKKVNKSIVKEEVKKPLVNEKLKKKKNIPAPIVVEEPVVVEEKVEDEDLSKWLEEHIED